MTQTAGTRNLDGAGESIYRVLASDWEAGDASWAPPGLSSVGVLTGCSAAVRCGRPTAYCNLFSRYFNNLISMLLI